MSADVLIVGAGLAGLSLATALGRAGFQVTVVDAAERPAAPVMGRSLADWDLRVSALTPASIDFLSGLGVWQRLPADRLAPYGAMKVWDADGSGEITFDAQQVEAPCLGQIIENRQLLHVLIQCAEGTPGVKVCWQHALESMSFVETQWEIHCHGGATISAPLLVGADGARSRVRALAGMPTRDWSYDQSAIVGTVALATSHEQTCWQAFIDSGPLALLPLADSDKVAIVWSLDDAEHAHIAALSDDAFVAALNRALGSRAPKAVAVGPRASFPLRQSHAIDYEDQGLVLVADAAHSIHPLAGQGINLGITDVRVLARELTLARDGGLTPASPVPLRRFQRQRKTENLAMMVAMEGFKRGFGNQNPFAVVARNVGLNFVDRRGWLKKWLTQRAIS